MISNSIKEALKVLFKLTSDGHLDEEEFLKLVNFAIETEKTKTPVYIPYQVEKQQEKQSQHPLVIPYSPSITRPCTVDPIYSYTQV